MRSFGKRSGTLAIAMALALACAACGSKNASGTGETSAPAASEEASAAPEEASAAAEEPAAEAPTSDYAVTIDAARLISDYEGNPAVAVDYTFTNVSHDEATSMAVAVHPEVYQGGAQCETAFTMDVDTGGYMQKVKAGASVPVTLVYKLHDTSSDVEVEVKEMFSWDDTLLAQRTFSLAEA